MANKFDIDQLRLQIEAIVREMPELQEDEQLRADMLDGLTEMPEVLEALFRVAAHSKMMVDALDGRIVELADRQSRFKQRIKTLRDLMLQVMQSADLKKVELPEATLSQRKSQPQIVGEPDVDTLPEKFVRVSIEPNRAAIREALLNGENVGDLYLSNAAPTLAINVK